MNSLCHCTDTFPEFQRLLREVQRGGGRRLDQPLERGREGSRRENRNSSQQRRNQSYGTLTRIGRLVGWAFGHNCSCADTASLEMVSRSQVL